MSCADENFSAEIKTDDPGAFQQIPIRIAGLPRLRPHACQTWRVLGVFVVVDFHVLAGTPSQDLTFGVQFSAVASRINRLCAKTMGNR